MVSKEISCSWFVARRKASSWRTAAISSSSPAAASLSSQARKRVTAAPSRTWAARAPLISAAFLTAFRAMQGSGPRATRRGPPSALANAKAAVCGIEAHPLLGLAQRLQPVVQRPRRREFGDCLEVGARGCVELLGRDEELGLSRLGHDGEREHDGSVGDVVAADVERPGDRVAQRQHDGVVPVGLQPLLDVGDLVLGGAAGELRGAHVTGLVGAAGRSLPQTRSTRLRVTGFSLMLLALSAASRCSISLTACSRGSKPTVWPRPSFSVIQSASAAARQLGELHDAGVDFGAGLHGVAAVDEEGR